MSPVKPIPEGYHTITPYMVVHDAEAAIEFYKRAFGAQENCRMPGPDGKTIMHAEIKIGDSVIMMSNECREFGQLAPTTLGGTAVKLHIYVEDVDAAFERAVLAGATIDMPVTEMFWGDRYGKLTDPFGHGWSIATHVKDLTPEQMAQGAQKAMAEMAGAKK